MAEERERLLKEVWPDKRLYAGVMLMLAGGLGVFFHALLLVLNVKFSPELPRILLDLPLWNALASLGVVVLAFLQLRLHKDALGFAAAGLGVLSLGLLGVESLLSLLALAFLAASRHEGEHLADAPHTSMWPDKSLAASLLALVSGVVALAWGALLLAGLVSMASAVPVGALALVAGVVNVAAAQRMFHQRGRWLGVAAGAVGFFGFAFYAVGPVLGIATLVLVQMAARENEFRS